MRFRPRSTAHQLKSVAYRYSNGFCGALKGMRSMLFKAGIRGSERVQELVSPRVRDHRLQRLESVLFLAREPLTSRKLSQYANLADGTESRTLIRRLNQLYDRSGRAFRVERVAGGYQILTRSLFASWVRRLEHVPRETRLSAPAMETLAVVAYRQPVLRADVEAIRGVGCGEVLRQLMERNLVRIGGRSDELGRPYLYTTTKQFLRTFGLENLDGLPRVAAIGEDGEQQGASPSKDQTDLQDSARSGETETAANEGEESNMPVSTRSDTAVDEQQDGALLDQLVAPQLASTFGEDEDCGEFYDDDDDDYDEYDDEDYDDEDPENEWEEVDDDDPNWNDDDDSDWGYDDDDDDEEDEEWD